MDEWVGGGLQKHNAHRNVLLIDELERQKTNQTLCWLTGEEPHFSMFMVFFRKVLQL